MGRGKSGCPLRSPDRRTPSLSCGQMPGTPTSALPDHGAPHSSLAALRKLESPVVSVIEDLVPPRQPSPQPSQSFSCGQLGSPRLGVETSKPVNPAPLARLLPILARPILVLQDWSGPRAPCARHCTPTGRRASLSWVECLWDPTLPSAAPEQFSSIHHFHPVPNPHPHPFALLQDPRELSVQVGAPSHPSLERLCLFQVPPTLGTLLPTPSLRDFEPQ